MESEKLKILTSTLFIISVVILSMFFTFYLGKFSLLTSAQNCPTCDCSGYPICSGNYRIDCSCEPVCCERNQTTGECIKWGSVRNIIPYNCGSSGYVCENDENIAYWSCGCSNGNCYSNKISVSNCGQETESDGGDDPRVPGKVTDYFCSGGSIPCYSSGSCQSATYSDYCSGICDRSELTEYYLNGEKVESKKYTDLFSKGQYCKGSPGAIYDDNLKPSVSLSPYSGGWTSGSISVYIYCDDHDESGCKNYYYTISRIV